MTLAESLNSWLLDKGFDSDDFNIQTENNIVKLYTKDQSYSRILAALQASGTFYPISCGDHLIVTVSYCF